MFRVVFKIEVKIIIKNPHTLVILEHIIKRYIVALFATVVPVMKTATQSTQEKSFFLSNIVGLYVEKVDYHRFGQYCRYLM